MLRSILDAPVSRRPSTLRVLRTSLWVVYHVMRRSMRQRAGGPLTYLLNAAFFVGIFGQVGGMVWQQYQRFAGLLAHGQGARASGQAAAIFLLDGLGILLLLPPAMIRADGIVGKQRAAIDTELWLALPLDGRQRVVARLGQATFFLSLLGIFLFSHLLAPALVFGPSPAAVVALFGVLALAALLLIVGGGVAGYAAARRYLPPYRQGQLVAWAGLALLPLGYAYVLVARGTGGALGDRLAEWLLFTPVSALLQAVHEGRTWAALRHGGILLALSGAAGSLGWTATLRLGREAVDDLSPLIRTRRYPMAPGQPRSLSLLAKDLLISTRDPTHRGVLIGSMLVVSLPLTASFLTSTSVLAQLRVNSGDAPLLALGYLAVGISVLMAAGQWVPLEARALEWLRTSGLTPHRILISKGKAASLQAIVLTLPVYAVLLLRVRGQTGPHPLLLPLFAVGMAWFMVGDTAARFPQSRRDTRPVQLRSIYAGYLIVICASIVMPLSLSAAVAALILLGLGALGRIDAGADALAYLDDPPPEPGPVRFADAWLAGAGALAVQGLVAVLLLRYVRHGGSALLAVLVAYTASAAVLLVLSITYLSRRRDTAAPGASAWPVGSWFGPPASHKGYAIGVCFGVISAAVAVEYAQVLPLVAPVLVHNSAPFAGLGIGPTSLYLRIAAGLVFTVIDPLAEELFFRGWILRGLELRLGRTWISLVLAALFFMVLHPALSYLPVAVLGLCAGMTVRLSGSLRPAILCHTIHNAVPMLVLVFGSSGKAA